MNRTFVGELLIFLLLTIGSLAREKPSDTLSLTDGSVLQVNLTNLHDSVPYMRQVSIKASSNATFNIINISSNASFIIFQIHTYQHNVTLSYDKDYLNKISNKSVFGSNIGLFSRLTKNIVTQLFVKNDNVHDVNGLLAVVAYHNKAPIPGGCNMEFNTEIAPYASVQTLDTMVIVDVQPASVPLNDSAKLTCEKNPVEVEMYQIFLNEQDFSINSYFTAITSMLTVTDIKEKGVKVANPVISSPIRRVFSAYTGVGSVYVALATYGKYSAAYVPSFSYACHPTIDPASCDVLPNLLSKIVCAFCFFVGLLSICFGHHHLKADMALPVFFTGTVIGYAAVGDILIAMGIGLCFTIFWLLCLSYLPIVFSGIMFNMTLGFLFACIAYFLSPDSFIILQNDWIFWSLFMTLALSVSLIMTIIFQFGFVITCSIIASFMVILPFDYWTGSALKYIVINIIRRITVEGFNSAAVRPPSEANDIALIIFWSCLVLYRIWKQWCKLGVLDLAERTPLLR
ncbi:transmembrane 7 superfamily member 3-like isoform X1 [Bombus huntii]|uniref:transmembrane 7 superfamily member 3-like isoform X1 n=2 Tax=Bombus huntii TaxID=85661 RepID=UPI0021A9B738|nr:transmembrane 7 superfamily member 3-like isoform X1 [Bombus huntii]